MTYLKEDDVAAFPSLHAIGDLAYSQGGMSLRDWFAGQALAVAWDARDKGYYEGDDNDMARCAYSIADAMLEARSAKKLSATWTKPSARPCPAATTTVTARSRTSNAKKPLT